MCEDLMKKKRQSSKHYKEFTSCEGCDIVLQPLAAFCFHIKAQSSTYRAGVLLPHNRQQGEVDED